MAIPRCASGLVRLLRTAALANPRSGRRKTVLAFLRLALERGFCFMASWPPCHNAMIGQRVLSGLAVVQELFWRLKPNPTSQSPGRPAADSSPVRAARRRAARLLCDQVGFVLV